MPASSKISAVYMSYAVSIAHFSPRSFIACRCGTRTRRCGAAWAPVPYGAVDSAAGVVEDGVGSLMGRS